MNKLTNKEAYEIIRDNTNWAWVYPQDVKFKYGWIFHRTRDCLDGEYHKCKEPIDCYAIDSLYSYEHTGCQLENLCKRRFNMVNRSHMIRQLIIDSIEKENTIKKINKENNNQNYLSYEEYSLVYSVLKDSLKAIFEKEKVDEILKKLYYISILDYKQLNIFENNESHN